MALVVRAPAEALLSNGKEAAVFDRTGAEITQQQDCVHKDNGYVTLGQVVLDVLNGYCAVRKKTDTLSERGRCKQSAWWCTVQLALYRYTIDILLYHRYRSLVLNPAGFAMDKA